MSKVYTGAEARALREAATGGPFDSVKINDEEFYGDFIVIRSPGDIWTMRNVAIVSNDDGVSGVMNAAMFAAAPDLARSVEHWEARARAVEALLSDVMEALRHTTQRDHIVDLHYEALVEKVCQGGGYGALMDSAQRVWRRREEERYGGGGGEHVAGPCRATVDRWLAKYDAIGQAEPVAGLEARALAAEAEAAHLRNVLLVERGEGVPPEGGWVAGRNCYPWQRTHTVRGKGEWTCRIQWSACHSAPWSIPCEEGHIGVEGRFATAYEAMEAANAEIRRRS